MKLSSFSLGAKLGAAFLIVVALTAGVGALSVTQLARVNANTEEIAGNWLPSIEAMANLRNGLNEFRRAESLHVLAPGDEEMAVQEQRMDELKKRIAETLATSEKLLHTPEERELHVAMVRQLQAYYASNRSLVELSSGDGKLAQTKRHFREESHLALAEALKTIAAMIDRNVRGGEEAYASARATYAQARAWVIGMVVAALVVAMLLAAWLTRLITRPVARAVEAAGRIAAGDLTVELDVQGRDETARLLQALDSMKHHLAAIVADVRQGAEGVATASAQIAQGNSDLSSRTEEQACALEETAASMEQLGSTVTQNADNAKQANQLAMNASSVASEGGEVVGRVVGTMKDINESSRKIGDIIGVIDGIAFQTNILALNAAVEAARAGEQGRGFAVVAGEVRSLAQRSAEAARQIKSLITASVERVEHGTLLVDQAGATMTEIVTSIKRVTDIMGEISAASAEQSEGVGQVGQAVSQMDDATQQNAALVEQSAAAAESLREQARGLVQAVAVFKLAGDEGRGDAAALGDEMAGRAQHERTAEAVRRAERPGAGGRVRENRDAGNRDARNRDGGNRDRENRAAGNRPARVEGARAEGVGAAHSASTPAPAQPYTGIERRGPNRAKNVTRPAFGRARTAAAATAAPQSSGSDGAAANGGSDSWESF